MPITMQLLKRENKGKIDLYFPQFICDVCQKPILFSGNYIYPVNTVSKYDNINPEGSIFFLHKYCTYGFDRVMNKEHPEFLWCSGELKEFICHLYTNFTDKNILVNEPISIYLMPFNTVLSDTVNIDNKQLNQSGIYFLFDDNDNLLYIGQSKNMQYRLKNNHHIYEDWHKIRFCSVDDDIRIYLETVLIKLLSPKLNIKSNNRVY